MNRVNTRCLIVWQLTQQPSPVFAHKYFSCPRMSRVNRIFITFAFVFDASGCFFGVCPIISTHTHDTSVNFLKEQKKKEIRSTETMTNFICQFSRPIFCQFNILLLDRPTLTTYFHWSEKDTRFLLFLQTQFLWEQFLLFISSVRHFLSKQSV